MTITQQMVINARVRDGYETIGMTDTEYGVCPVLCKGKHVVVVNGLGYDIHTAGRTYKLREQK